MWFFQTEDYQKLFRNRPGTKMGNRNDPTKAQKSKLCSYLTFGECDFFSKKMNFLVIFVGPAPG
jgi:hypothetical protein